MDLLRSEANRVRELVQSCREDGVDLRPYRERLRIARALVTQHRLVEALAHLRELKLQLLDQIVLAEVRSPELPGTIENPPVPPSPPENPLREEERLPPTPRGPSWKVKLPKR